MWKPQEEHQPLAVSSSGRLPRPRHDETRQGSCQETRPTTVHRSGLVTPPPLAKAARGTCGPIGEPIPNPKLPCAKRCMPWATGTARITGSTSPTALVFALTSSSRPGRSRSSWTAVSGTYAPSMVESPRLTSGIGPPNSAATSSGTVPPTLLLTMPAGESSGSGNTCPSLMRSVPLSTPLIPRRSNIQANLTITSDIRTHGRAGYCRLDGHQSLCVSWHAQWPRVLTAHGHRTG